MVDCHKLNENTGPLHAAVPSITNLIFSIEQAAQPWMAALAIKDTFSTVPLQPEDRERFAFIWGRIQFAFTLLPQVFKRSPTFSHQALARESEQVPREPGVTVYQYTDDILNGGDSPSKVQIMHDRSGNCRILASTFSRVCYNCLTLTRSVKEPCYLGMGS